MKTILKLSLLTAGILTAAVPATNAADAGIAPAPATAPAAAPATKAGALAAEAVLPPAGALRKRAMMMHRRALALHRRERAVRHRLRALRREARSMRRRSVALNRATTRLHRRLAFREQVVKTLGITPAQISQLRADRANTVAAVKSIRTDKSLTPDQRKAKIRAALQAGRAQLQAVLTPDQQAKFAHLRARLHRRLRG